METMAMRTIFLEMDGNNYHSLVDDGPLLLLQLFPRERLFAFPCPAESPCTARRLAR
jgi:hypothetical protein